MEVYRERKRREQKTKLGICGNRSNNDGKEEHINNKGSREKIREERERKRQRSFGNSILVLPMVCKPVVCPL